MEWQGIVEVNDMFGASRDFESMDKALAYAWMKTPNQQFQFSTPVEVVVKEGFLGLARIHQYLENCRLD